MRVRVRVRVRVGVGARVRVRVVGVGVGVRVRAGVRGRGRVRLAALVPVEHPANEVAHDRVPRRGADERGQEDAAREHGVLAVGSDVVRHRKRRDEARLREDELAHLG